MRRMERARAATTGSMIILRVTFGPVEPSGLGKFTFIFIRTPWRDGRGTKGGEGWVTFGQKHEGREEKKIYIYIDVRTRGKKFERYSHTRTDGEDIKGQRRTVVS